MFEKLRKSLPRSVIYGLVVLLALVTVGYLALYHPVTSLYAIKSPGEQGKVADAQAGAYGDDLWLMARVIEGEAAGEPFVGKVAIGAVLMNRMQNASFPNTLAGVIFEPYAFESVSNGLIWQSEPSDESVQAAQSALSGWDPTYGAIFFWNPSKPVSPWVWSREIITQIGSHIFAR